MRPQGRPIAKYDMNGKQSNDMTGLNDGGANQGGT